MYIICKINNIISYNIIWLRTINIYNYIYIQVHLKKFEYGEKVKSYLKILFQKVPFSYILDSLHVKF